MESFRLVIESPSRDGCGLVCGGYDVFVLLLLVLLLLLLLLLLVCWLDFVSDGLFKSKISQIWKLLRCPGTFILSKSLEMRRKKQTNKPNRFDYYYYFRVMYFLYHNVYVCFSTQKMYFLILKVDAKKFKCCTKIQSELVAVTGRNKSFFDKKYFPTKVCGNIWHVKYRTSCLCFKKTNWKRKQ